MKHKSYVIMVLAVLTMFVMPSSAKAAMITSGFGWRVHPISGDWKFHSGVDIGYDEGTPVTAMLPGVVVYSAWYGGYGYTVIIEHEGGDHTLYAHCSGLLCEYGQYVDKGTVIAAVGSTGYSTGPHLHLEYWHNNQYSDPLVLWG
ncbi:M23 family metallopeptidase [Phascolarctobacterium sp.]